MSSAWLRVLIESILEQESPSQTGELKFWHGGDLSSLSFDGSNEFSQKKGRYEFGPGLYLTTHYDTAKKYAKGNRKLYVVTVSSGTELHDVTLSLEDALEAVNRFSNPKMRSEISERIKARSGGSNSIKAFIVANNLLNTDGALRSNKTGELRQWLVDIGADYQLVNSPFGWGETMMVLYNTKKITNVKQIGPKDEENLKDFH